jgi:hypothetical protein
MANVVKKHSISSELAQTSMTLDFAGTADARLIEGVSHV